jgi:hypothetical protein
MFHLIQVAQDRDKWRGTRKVIILLEQWSHRRRQKGVSFNE